MSKAPNSDTGPFRVDRQTDRTARALEGLRQGFDKPLRIEHLTRDLGMSSSGFYEHFKAVTAMSPLQFQKQLRLQEARRLLFGEDIDAVTDAYRVGYDNASHFSREYKQHVGALDAQCPAAAGNIGKLSHDLIPAAHPH